MGIPTDTRVEDIQSAVLQSAAAQVTILSLGAITQDWQVPLGSQTERVVLGYADPADYLNNAHFLGIIAGRVANRIGHGQFSLDGQVYHLPINNAPHTLHSGPAGLGSRNWTLTTDGDRAVQLTYHSPDGEEGFPGVVDFTVTIKLDGATLSYEMVGVPDRPTPINLAQHSYYTLGMAKMDEMLIQIPAAEISVCDETLLPTGQIGSVTGSAWDFQEGRFLQDADPDHDGIDQNFILSDHPARIRMSAPNGLALEMETDQPGLQLYTAKHLEQFGTPFKGQTHHAFAGVCLEPQNFPDAVNQPGFPNVIYTPDRPYVQNLSVSIGETS